MLQTMRSHAGSWFIKFLLAAIIASFAFFGIGDIIKGYQHGRPVATVGGYAIGMEEFSYAYKLALTNLQHTAKKAITPEQAKELGLPQQVLDNLINKVILEQEMTRLGVVVSDKTIIEEVHAIPAFLTKNGTFDHAMFEQIIHAQGLSEGRFISEVRKELQQHQVIGGLTSPLNLSDAYVRILFQALEQPLQFVSVDIPFKKIPLQKEIKMADVELFYNANKEQFRVPELRTITLLRFDRDALKKQMTVSEDAIKEEYERRAGDFASPEKRTIESITVSTKDAAQKAIDAFNMGKPLKTIARELKGSYKDFGSVTKDQWPVDAHTNALFSLSLGTPSEMFDTDQGYVIYVVTKIVPGSQKSLSEAIADIESSLKDDTFNEYFESLQNKVEDDLAGGLKTQEVASKYNLTIETLKAVDRNGHDSDGAKVLEGSTKKDILDYAFSNPQGSESNVILAKADKDTQLIGFIVRVDAIQPSFIPDFKGPAQAKIIEAYKTDLQKQEASKIARDIAKNATSVEELKKQAAAHKVSFSTLPPISRASVDQDESLKNEMMGDTIERMFTLPEGEALAAPTRNGFKVIMFQSKLPYTIDNAKLEKFKASIKIMLQRDFVHLYRNYLRQTHYPVTVNQDQMDQVVGHTS